MNMPKDYFCIQSLFYIGFQDNSEKMGLKSKTNSLLLLKKSRKCKVDYCYIFISNHTKNKIENKWGIYMYNFRTEKIINREWKFIHEDLIEGIHPSYDDGNWYDVHLPHSFSMPYWGESSFYVGFGFYRKKIEIEEEWMDKHICLEFGAAFQDAEIYINGKKAGSHRGGYTAFVIDITPYIQIGENCIAVRLNNLWSPTIAPRAGEHTFCGGLYRDVKLIIVDQVHVAWYGTFITTKEESNEGALLNIETELENKRDRTIEAAVKTEIFDLHNNLVSSLQTEVKIESGMKKILKQDTKIENPYLWSPNSPNLYTAITTIYVEGQPVDDYSTSFGIRWFEFSKNTGFWLNGEHLYLQGANVHQDHGGFGDAVTHTGIQRDVAMIKECGMNFIRGSHYPHHTVFAQECDKQGMLFWSELCFWGIGGFGEEGYWFSSAYPVREEDKKGFEESCIQTLKEMIRTNRNHPSIITWSMGNEMFFTKEEVMEEARELVRTLVKVSHKEDDTRPASVGGVQRCGFDSLGDVAGYNGDGAILYMNPDFPSLVAEYGSVPSLRPGDYDLCFSEGSEEQYPWRSGRAIWCGFHHGSIANIGNLGIVDLYRLPLRSWYCYREELRGIPHPVWPIEGIPSYLKVTSDRYYITNDGTQDCQIIIELYDENNRRISNSIDVVLCITQGPGYFPTGKTIVLNSEIGNFLDGVGSVEFRSYYNGNTIIEVSAQGLEKTKIEITTMGKETDIEKPICLPPQQEVYKYEKVVDETVDLAKNRPCKVSSEQAGHLRCYVNDNAEDTYWMPNEEDQSPWWQIDLENIYQVDSIAIRYLNYVTNGIVIEQSYNGTQWIKSEISQAMQGEDNVVYKMHNCIGRYLKITCTPDKAFAIKKLEVIGKTVD